MKCKLFYLYYKDNKIMIIFYELNSGHDILIFINFIQFIIPYIIQTQAMKDPMKGKILELFNIFEVFMMTV